MTMSVAHETDGAALLRRADAALYEAKRRGRNGHWYDGDGFGENATLHDATSQGHRSAPNSA